MPLFSLRDVTFRYPSQEEDALHDVSCDIEAGELVAVLGGDGAGKSTFAKLLNGIIPHMARGALSGSVLFRGTPTTELRIADLVRQVGLVLQDPDVQMFLDSVEEELAFGPENLAVPPAEIEKRIERTLALMEISEIRMKSPKALSGGQKQRLAIASILTMGTEIVVLDEPFSMLDQLVKKDLLDILKMMCVREKMTVVVTSQDAEDVYRYCDRLILLSRGRIASIGTPMETLTSSEALISLGIEPPQILLAIDEMRAAGNSVAVEKLTRYFISQMSGGKGTVIS